MSDFESRIEELRELIHGKKRKKREMNNPITTIIAAVSAVILLILGGMYAIPKYQVWQQGLKGEAELARAEQNRRVAVMEAQAKKDAAKLLAEAEIERAKGVAEANAIVADGLKGNDEYLRYLWIDKIADNTKREIIYIPTEAGMPLLEAGRASAPAPVEQK